MIPYTTPFKEFRVWLILGWGRYKFGDPEFRDSWSRCC